MDRGAETPARTSSEPRRGWVLISPGGPGRRDQGAVGAAEPAARGGGFRHRPGRRGSWNGPRGRASRAMPRRSRARAVVFTLIGDAGQPYLAFGFAGLSGFADVLWLAHPRARRRGALRASGRIARRAPVYVPPQGLREPELTRKARTLALERDLGVHQSLAARRRDRRARRLRRLGQADQPVPVPGAGAPIRTVRPHRALPTGFGHRPTRSGPRADAPAGRERPDVRPRNRSRERPDNRS